MHAQPSSWARCLILGRTLRLLSYVMCGNSEGSSETVRIHRLTWAFTGRLCDKYHNLMSWLILENRHENFRKICKGEHFLKILTLRPKSWMLIQILMSEKHHTEIMSNLRGCLHTRWTGLTHPFLLKCIKCLLDTYGFLNYVYFSIW